jgi:hypothetical protein
MTHFLAKPFGKRLFRSLAKAPGQFFAKKLRAPRGSICGTMKQCTVLDKTCADRA